MLKFGNCLDGRGWFQSCQNCLDHFLLRTYFFEFVLLGYYRGITGVLCVIFLLFIGFSLNISTHLGESAPQVHTFGGGVDYLVNVDPLWI